MIYPFTSVTLSAVALLQRKPLLLSILLIWFSVRIVKDLNSPQLYAVKFIDKISALNGHDPKSGKGHAILHQIALEVALHRTCAEHKNVIGFVATMETPVWRWIALEFAEGGDLFDKIGASIELFC
jgi:serine/threonine protein kinase